MLTVYRHMFTIPDLRRKILATLLLIGIYRLGAAVPVPGVSLVALERMQDQADAQGIFGLLNLFSGGAFENFSIFALGVLPYITASIIMQLLVVVIPRLQRLQEEGDQKTVTQWTRYMTVILALIQSTTISAAVASGASHFTGGIRLIPDFTPSRAALIVITMTAGTAFVMWLGELITQRGVGNGMSLLIFVSIVSQLPQQIASIYSQTVPIGLWGRFVVMMFVFLVMTVGILYIDQGQRRIPIQFANRVRGRKVFRGGSTYIPMKVNTAGVIPVIFATSVLYFPVLLITLIPNQTSTVIASIRDWINVNLAQALVPTWTYIAALFFLILFFTYFYTAIQFDPVKQAESIQRQGGFVPGIRPGSQTVAHLQHILNRITLPGAVFLGAVAVLPSIAGTIWNIGIAFSGVSLMIVVGVALETMKQVESQLTMRNYEGFLT